tara:strand:+ start:4036 stop:4440 length:405 start_codon:yes stop_codon:yes gene_type:complete
MSKLNVVAGILLKNNKILLPKRSISLKYSPNKYEFPGGKVENGETLKDALKRELYEELSIDVNTSNIIDFPNNILETDKILLTLFVINSWSNNLKLNPEINSEILEVEINELENVEDLLETDKELIPAIVKFLK